MAVKTPRKNSTPKNTSTKRKPKQATAASKADRYQLYLESVQAPEHETPFFNRVYKKAFGVSPKILREDFCGTFAVCCDWVKSSKDRVAIGIDLDPEPLAWGEKHHLAPLSENQQQRITLKQEDVRYIDKQKADVLAAQNFSFWIFKTRSELLAYFKAAYKNLKNQGVMVLDMMGGSETIEEEHVDETEYDGFDYIWEQARFDPITHDCSFYIHFHFDDGSKMKRAFQYHWRFWTIPEVSELLKEAGFGHVDVYWEGTDDEDEGNGIFTARHHAPSEPAWISYMVATKE